MSNNHRLTSNNARTAIRYLPVPDQEAKYFAVRGDAHGPIARYRKADRWGSFTKGCGDMFALFAVSGIVILGLGFIAKTDPLIAVALVPLILTAGSVMCALGVLCGVLYLVDRLYRRHYSLADPPCLVTDSGIKIRDQIVFEDLTPEDRDLLFVAREQDDNENLSWDAAVQAQMILRDKYREMRAQHEEMVAQVRHDKNREKLEANGRSKALAKKLFGEPELSTGSPHSL